MSNNDYTPPCPTCGAPARHVSAGVWTYAPSEPRLLPLESRQSQQKLVVDEHVFTPPIQRLSWLDRAFQQWKK